MVETSASKHLVWVGSSREDFHQFPDEVKSEIGYALFVAQCGGRHRATKTFKGTGDAGIVEIVARHHGDAFRAVYTVRFSSAVYVLHAFQKKSKTGVATPMADVRLIEQRLREAKRLHEETTR